MTFRRFLLSLSLFILVLFFFTSKYETICVLKQYIWITKNVLNSDSMTTKIIHHTSDERSLAEKKFLKLNETKSLQGTLTIVHDFQNFGSVNILL